MEALYVHIPFCSHICSYCDFCKVYYQEDWASQYLDALFYEMTEKQLPKSFQTIYIGGGTPSALSHQQLEKLLSILEPYSHQVKEYSIEVNPESVTIDKLKLMKNYGINRLSVGVQTFQDSLLPDIERYHTSSQAIEIIQQAYELGIHDINVDLIYGLPHQTIEDVKKDIEIINQLPISHVSIYSLILEDHTILKNQGYQPLDEEQDALWYELINEELAKKGFQHYEISNYYKTKPSYHNLTYWHYKEYEGIGLGAHALKNHQYIENTKSLQQYFKHHFIKEVTSLSQDDELFEKLMMGLRLTEGVCIDEINQLYKRDFLNEYHDVIEKHMRLHTLVIEDGYLKTTPQGMNCLNAILIDFL